MPVARWIIFLLLVTALPAPAWERFPDAKLVPSDFGDGDSFQVEILRDGKPETHVVRLYFVDCPETSASSETDRRRVLEQMRYFGLESPQQILEAGQAATLRTQELLQDGFEVQTAFASALGRSRLPRVYARIITAGGDDLAAILVREGLARNHGIGRATPDGISSADYSEILNDMELAAIMGKRGTWASSDPDRLITARAATREEERFLREQFGANTLFPINVNSASASELESIPGIGPVLAERIIAARPFDSLEELTTVQGISTTTVTKLAEYLSTKNPSDD